VIKRHLIFGLVASVALNLFAAGALVGTIIARHGLGARHAGAMGQLPGRGLIRASEGLSEPEREAFRQVLRDHAPQAQADVRRARDARNRGWAALDADTVDTVAIERDLNAARDLEIQARTRIEQGIVSYALTLPRADRAILAEGLTRRGTRSAEGGPKPGRE